MIALEKTLAEKLSNNHIVDGHDFGSGEMNIFVHTDGPQQMFEEAKSMLGSTSVWQGVRVAYRTLTGSIYTILWPNELKKFKVI